MDMESEVKSRSKQGGKLAKLICKYQSHFATAVIIAATFGVGISYGKLYLFHIVGAAFIFINLFLVINKNRAECISSFRFKAQFPLYIMFVWYILSLFWVDNIQLGLKYLFYIGCGLLIIQSMLIAGKDLKSQHKVLIPMAIIFLIEIVISLLEGTTSFRYPISPYYDGVDFFNRNIGYDPSLKASILEAIKNTPTGFRWNPNNLAVSMLITLPFFIFQPNRWLRYIASPAILIVILLTGSRGILIALFVMAIFLFLFYFNKKSKLIAVGLVAIFLITGLIFKPYIQEQYAYKLREISSTANAFQKYLFTDHSLINDSSSIAVRQHLISNGIDELYKSYGLGVGAGNSQVAQQQHGNTYGVYSMHNFWIEVLVEGGFLMFAIWSIWYFYIAISLIVLFRKTKNKEIRFYAKASSLAMVGFSIGMISMSSAIYFFPMWLLLGFGILTLKNAKSTDTPKEQFIAS